MMSIAKMRKNKWKKISENHCTSIFFHRVQMSASKASTGQYHAKAYGSTSNPMTDLHNETGNHQDQVKVLIEKTASSLDDTALKMLFVSVQQNNIDLCVRYAINLYVMFSLFVIREWLFSAWPIGSGLMIPSVLVIAILMSVRLNSIQTTLTRTTLSWFRHSYVSECSILWTGYSFRNRYQSVFAQNL